MRGQVLEVTAAGGMILGEDGQRYKFMGTDWKSAVAGVDGTEVDFVAVGERATQVYSVRAVGANWQAASRPTSGAGNSVLLGWLGIGCLVLSFVMPVLPVAGALLFGLVGASSAKANGNETGLLLSRIAWIGAVVLMAIGVVALVWFTAYAWPFFEVMWQVFIGMVREGTREGTQV
jgi:hypothetical protein